MNRRLIFGMSFVVLVSAGCASTADEPTTTTDSAGPTTTTTPITTTTVPTTTTTDVVEEASAPAAPAGPLSLPAYLGVTYRLDGQFTEAVLSATLNSAPEDLIAVQIVLYTGYVGVLSGIDPPEEAAAYHAELLALMQRALDVTLEAKTKIDSGTQAGSLEAGLELLSLADEMIAASFVIADEQRAVVIGLLAGRDDPESAYILELLALRNSDNTQAVESILTGATSLDITPEELAALFRDLVALFEATLADYRSLDPPGSWTTLYDDQVDLLETGIVVYTAIAEAAETGTEPDLETIFELIEFSQRGPALNAAVSTKLAEHFETLDGPLVTGSLPLMPADTAVDESAAGLAAPTVSGYDFTGQPVVIEDDGRAKAIVFLAHWCPNCQAEVPQVQAWLEATGGVEGVDLYSVATAISAERPNYPPWRWLLEEGWSVPVVRDNTDSDVHEAFGNGNFPFWVFTNSDGTVAMRAAGQIPIADLEAILAGLG